MSLKPAQKHTIDQADRDVIRDEFAAMLNTWAGGRWLPQRNRYRNACIKRITEDIKPGKRLRHKYLREYIAASSIVHCFDGWSYLARSVGAHLRGDRNASRHLGYYSELRAAMALLATEGIGVFNFQHFVVTDKKRCERINSRGTHVFVWDALEYWSQQPRATDIIFRIIKPGGLPLNQWLDNFSSRIGFQSIIAERWLQQWGLDLKNLRDDHKARNQASYRPNAFTGTSALDAQSAVLFLRGLWETCEPLGSLCFPELDKHLLRSGLELAFKSAHNRTRKQAKPLFKRLVDVMLHDLSPLRCDETQLREFLNSDTVDSASILLKQAAGKDKASAASHHQQVMARATMLLRVASGACQDFIAASPDSVRDALEFWWKDIGVERSLWDRGQEPDNFSDLWSDIAEATSNLHSWQEIIGTPDFSYHKVWSEQPESAAMLTSCERIALWGMGL